MLYSNSETFLYDDGIVNRAWKPIIFQRQIDKHNHQKLKLFNHSAEQLAQSKLRVISASKERTLDIIYYIDKFLTEYFKACQNES